MFFLSFNFVFIYINTINVNKVKFISYYIFPLHFWLQKTKNIIYSNHKLSVKVSLGKHDCSVKENVTSKKEVQLNAIINALQSFRPLKNISQRQLEFRNWICGNGFNRSTED